jgi:hypothetical protein
VFVATCKLLLLLLLVKLALRVEGVHVNVSDDFHPVSGLGLKPEDCYSQSVSGTAVASAAACWSSAVHGMKTQRFCMLLWPRCSPLFSV